VKPVATVTTPNVVPAFGVHANPPLLEPPLDAAAEEPPPLELPPALLAREELPPPCELAPTELEPTELEPTTPELAREDAVLPLLLEELVASPVLRSVQPKARAPTPKTQTIRFIIMVIPPPECWSCPAVRTG